MIRLRILTKPCHVASNEKTLDMRLLAMAQDGRGFFVFDSSAVKLLRITCFFLFLFFIFLVLDCSGFGRRYLLRYLISGVDRPWVSA